ncbi:hypothetical protein GCM10027020_35770 [Nocardioides salsibiostraticola]
MARGSVTGLDVVDAALGIVDVGGFEALSVRRVADALGVSRQVVYTHHGSMTGLLDALHRHASALLAYDVGSAPGERGTVEHLQACTAVYLRGARERPALYQLLFGPAVAGFTPSALAQQESIASFGHIVAAVDAYLHPAIDGESDRESSRATDPANPASWPSDAIDLAQLLWSGVHGLIDLERAGHATRDRTDALSVELVRRLVASP